MGCFLHPKHYFWLEQISKTVQASNLTKTVTWCAGGAGEGRRDRGERLCCWVKQNCGLAGTQVTAFVPYVFVLLHPVPQPPDFAKFVLTRDGAGEWYF